MRFTDRLKMEDWSIGGEMKMEVLFWEEMGGRQGREEEMFE